MGRISYYDNSLVYKIVAFNFSWNANFVDKNAILIHKNHIQMRKNEAKSKVPVSWLSSYSYIQLKSVISDGG